MFTNVTAECIFFFSQVDLLEKPINQPYHLIICRMLLQHLYFTDVFSLLKQFSQSNSSFLLTTTFAGNQQNEVMQNTQVVIIMKFMLTFPSNASHKGLMPQWPNHRGLMFSHRGLIHGHRGLVTEA